MRNEYNCDARRRKIRTLVDAVIVSAVLTIACAFLFAFGSKATNAIRKANEKTELCVVASSSVTVCGEPHDVNERE